MPIEVSAAGLRFARRLLNRKFRSAAGEFLVEGAPSVREALAAGAVRRLLATAEAASQHPDLVADGYELLAPGQVRQLSDTVTSPGLFAVCRLPRWGVEEVLTPQARLLVICAQIRDPGNLGTVIRCADAFGADAVLVTTDSVDPTNPKAVRASAGSVFHLPVVADVDLAVGAAQARRAGFQILAADGSGQDLNQLIAHGRLSDRVAWIMGNEAWGLPEADALLADATVAIPMWGRAESLNLATAAAVCLYATASRQHREG